MALEIIATPLAGYIPLTVSFSCLTELFPNQYIWEFGDGATSREAAPTHTYETAGEYTVKCRVADANSQTQITEVTITVETPATPEVTLSTDITEAYAPAEINLTYDILGGIPDDYVLEWDFADGHTATKAINGNDGNLSGIETYTYTRGGTYNICLTVKNNNGNITTSAVVTVKVLNPLSPNIEIKLSNRENFAPARCEFYAELTNGAPEDYTLEWDFDNGTHTTSEHSPVYTFQEAGTHTIRLTVANNDGRTRTTKEVLIAVLEPRLIDVFINPPTHGEYAPQTITFTAELIDTGEERPNAAPDEYTWDFGDGYTSNDITTTHTFTAAGEYKITLTATGCEGKATVQSETTVTLKTPTYPVIVLKSEQDGATFAEITNCTEYIDITPSRVVWDFGDGEVVVATTEEGMKKQTHTFKTPGIHTVTVTLHYETGYFHTETTRAVLFLMNSNHTGIMQNGSSKRRR